jgi:hypothetical protein
MKENTNYKKWSFKFLIYIILLNILIAFMVANLVNQTGLVIQLEGYEEPKNYTGMYVLILNIVINLLFIAGVILTILSLKNKEEKDYKYKFSIYGYPIFILLSVIIYFL